MSATTPEQDAILSYLKQHEVSEKLSRAVNKLCQVRVGPLQAAACAVLGRRTQAAV